MTYDVNLLVILGLVSSAGPDCPSNSTDFEKMDPVEAVVGSNTTLPCIPKFDFNYKDNEFVLRWDKTDKIYTFKIHEVKFVHKNYTNRISISQEDLKKGNASLSIIGVKKSDEGKYCCGVNNKWTNVTLVVKEENREIKGREGDQQTTPSPNNATENWNVVVAVGGVVVVVAVVAVGGLIVYCCWNKSKGDHSARYERGQGEHGIPDDPTTIRMIGDNTTGQDQDGSNVRQRSRNSQRHQCFVV
ncbi:uncharacterized protein [Embiotoca jacksoni]|uniref:uncharacterized protein n=1 Tax=Embiotoca jacksoni TaxID=100190 RepID=UPI0037043B61